MMPHLPVEPFSWTTASGSGFNLSESISPWRSAIPQAASSASQVDAVIGYLVDKYNTEEQGNALVLLRRVLSDNLLTALPAEIARLTNLECNSLLTRAS